MIKYAILAAATLVAVTAAPQARAEGEGTFRPNSYALGFSGAPVRPAPAKALPTYNEGNGGDMDTGRPSAKVSGVSRGPITSFELNEGADGGRG